jgi:iron(III) transport system ATP-binding protein
MLLEFQNISKNFGAVKALRNVSFSLAENEIVTVLGESGSGKSTLLRIAAGFETPDQGTILNRGKVLNSATDFIVPHLRKFGMVFQDFALFPHLTVRENVGFALPNTNKKERINQLLESVHIAALSERYPHELSGGQQQRVAMARALSINPDLLLLDEPFSSLDHSIRSALRREVENTIRSFEKSALIVTHDAGDAMDLADKILILQQGELIQFDSPNVIMENPANIYVASLFGPVNIIQSSVAGTAKFFRPWEAEISDDLNGKFCGIVEKSVYSGACYRIYISSEDTTFAIDNKIPLLKGAKVRVVPNEALIKTTRS